MNSFNCPETNSDGNILSIMLKSDFKSVQKRVKGENVARILEFLQIGYSGF